MAQLQAIEGIVATPKVTPQLAMMCRELPLTASPSTVPRMLAPPSGTKQWCPSSDQEAAALRAEEEEAASLDVSQEEHSPQKWKERRPFVKFLKESCQGGLLRGS